MVTSEDRKEVVKALHDLCDGCETVSDYDLAKALCLVAVSRYTYSSDSVLRIADLIDLEPERTCHAVEDVSVGGFVSWRCSECEQPINKADNYCSNCGAKVVEDERNN